MVNTREIAEEYRLSHWAQVAQEWIKRGETIKAYCKQIGISENTYFYWQRRLRRAACEEMTKLESEERTVTRAGFVEIEVAEPPAQPALPAPEEKATPLGQLSVEAGGVRITADSGYPPEKLAALLRELTRPC